MTKNIRLIVLMAGLALILAAGVIAQQKTADTAVDPVCGMTVVKANAKATFDYKGATYYFCSTGCKDSFAKDPEKYLKAAQEKAQAGQPAPMVPMGHMQGQMGQGQMGMMQHKEVQGQPMACMCDAGGRMGKDMANCPMMQGQGGMMPGGMMRGGMGGRMGMGMRRPGMMPPGMGMLFQLYGDKLDVTVENTKDGAVLKFSSKDPDVAKAIQVHLAEHLAMMKKMMEAKDKVPAAAAPQK
jgi:YHS domain-containing protein